MEVEMITGRSKFDGPWDVHEHEACNEIHPLWDEDGDYIIADVYMKELTSVIKESPEMLSLLHDTFRTLEGLDRPIRDTFKSHFLRYDNLRSRI
jgi:hypothetical protein